MKTRTAPIPPAAEPSESEIQKVAYRLWVEGGCREGVEIDNWFAAKELIRHHHGRAPGHSKSQAEATPAHAPTTAVPATR